LVFGRTRVGGSFLFQESLLNAAKAGTHEAKEQVRGAFQKFITALTTHANFLHPAFIHAAPQHLFHVHRRKITTDVIITLEAPREGISKLTYLNPIAGLAVEQALTTVKNSKKPPDELLLWESLPQELQHKCALLYKDDCELLGYEFNN
jgi:hypothetical protein